MEQKILIKMKNLNKEDEFYEEWKTIYLSSRAELQNDYIQQQLKLRNKHQRTIRCGCNLNEHLYLSSNKNSNDLYFLKRYPNQKEHKVECMFYSEVKEYIDHEDGNIIYKPTIFEEPNIRVNDGKNRPACESDIQRYTYYSYCQDLIASSCSFAFRHKNKNQDYKNLKNFGYKDFLFNLNIAIKNVQIKGVGSLHELCSSKDNGLRYSYGIINEDIREYLKKANSLDDNAILSISLDNGKILKTTKKRIEIASKRLKIYNNYIEPQYFFIAVSNYGVAVRLYLYPVYYDEENICFVESNYERKYAKYLYEQNITFIKPINNLEFQYIPSNKICPNKSKFKLNNRPDFIEFKDGRVKIVEVSGYDDRNYLLQMVDKEIDYKKIQEQYDYVDYEKVEGKELK